jgi:UDP-GlcNAc:undecaprenyl-phosphate GlcNAc-1-phosphate transferase
MGGLAVLVAYAGSLGVVMAVGKFPFHLAPELHTTIIAFLAGGVFLAVVGAIDDVKAVGARRKLLAQVMAASAAWYGGARVESLDFPLAGAIHLPLVVSYLVTLAWLLAFINAINLIDGLDGLAGGVVFFAAITNTAVAFISGNVLASLLNAALGGAVLGFLFYNFNPATIFLGDTGSMFLGYALGTSALLSGRQKESTLVSLLVPVIALGLPMTDTLFAMVRRFLARRPIFSADRGHIHHRLLDLGLTHRRAVLMLYGCSVLLCLAAVAAAFGKNWQVGAALTGAVLTIVGIARFAGYFEMALLKRAQRAHLLSAPTDSLRRALPRLVIEVSSADSLAATWAAVERLLDGGHFAYAEYVATGETAALWRWEPSDRNARREGKLIESEFPLRAFPGAGDGTLRFGCLSDEQDLSPQVEVLLQLVVDTVEDALVRVNVQRPSSMLHVVAEAP